MRRQSGRRLQVNLSSGDISLAIFSGAMLVLLAIDALVSRFAPWS